MDRRDIKTKVMAGANCCKSSDLNEVVMTDSKDTHDFFLLI